MEIMFVQGSCKNGKYIRDLPVEYQTGIPSPEILNDPISCGPVYQPHSVLTGKVSTSPHYP